MSRNRGIAILLATVASFASLPIELAVARPRIRINGPQPTGIPTNPPGRVPKQPPFSPVDLGDLIEKLSPSPDKTGRDNNTRHPSLCVDNLPEEEPHIQCPENSEQKKIIKEAIIIIAEALKEDIDRENKIVNSQLQNIESPVEQRLFLEQSHEILKGKIIKKSKKLNRTEIRE
ncbi:MAG: hypothetical protein N4J56_007279 [Chroococcidiopsis sp. SAG 2025]|uniref:hypothetical protein n=1 Tax=Chroococcidiopsis sp. SAG 2025 TaxID=171389 RepID=UPI002936E639|nr:hypothetical protein [Chroococcidiopsis sp. SAG 2025]MDV2997574.1 hypothetical protein [Chroococcidiopsis sp. SAG 2025]